MTGKPKRISGDQVAFTASSGGTEPQGRKGASIDGFPSSARALTVTDASLHKRVLFMQVVERVCGSNEGVLAIVSPILFSISVKAVAPEIH